MRALCAKLYKRYEKKLFGDARHPDVDGDDSCECPSI